MGNSVTGVHMYFEPQQPAGFLHSTGMTCVSLSNHMHHNFIPIVLSVTES